MSSDESDESTSQVKASSYDPFEATRQTPTKERAKADLTKNPALLNLMSSYKDQHDSESSGESGKKLKKTERSEDSESSSSPARKNRKTSVKRSRDHSARRHSRRRSKRRRSRSPTSKHHHRRRSRSRRRHKRRNSRSKFHYRDSSSSSADSRDHRRSHGSPKRRSRRRRSSSRRYHHRSSHHSYYRPHPERREPGPHRPPPPIAADCPKQPVEPKSPVAQPPEPIHHYYVPRIGNQTPYGQPSPNPVARHKPRANLIEIIPTQANLSTLTEVKTKESEEQRFPPCPPVNIGHSKDLSDYLVEEMLLEEEVKQKEQRKIAEEREAERLLTCLCRGLLDDLVELLTVADYVCEEANWQTAAEDEPPTFKQKPPVVSWLCQVNVEELNNQTTEDELVEEPKGRPATPVWPDTSNQDSSVGDQAANTGADDDTGAVESNRQIVDQWLEKDNKATASTTNGIDELMQRIFKGRHTDERIVSWISGDEVCPAAGGEPEGHSSGGDEPYDPEVEEARLTNRDDVGVAPKCNETEPSEHIEPLTIEELPSSATELYRIQKYRQKKQRMEQVIAFAKECIKPRYVRREIDKEQYKMVMKKTVDKYMQSGRPANKEKISQLINYYIAADDQLT